MRIMSFNVLCFGSEENNWTKRISAVVDTIKAAAPDSFGVQEATSEWMTALSTAFPSYGYVGVGRNDGDSDGERSAVFYLKRKYKLVDSDTFWLSETPDKPSLGWDANCVRICTYAVLENRETGVQYVHANTHLDHVGTTARVEGAKLLLERVGAFGLPTVLTGDFNSHENSQVYNFVTSGIFGDSKYLAPDSMSAPTFHGFSENPSGTPIDFVFVTKADFNVSRYRVINEKVGDRYASDHFALYADMSIN